MKRSSEIRELWAELEAARKGRSRDTILLSPTGVETRLGPVLVGIDALGQRHLCIPTEERELGSKDDASRGILLEVRPLSDRHRGDVPYLDVTCLVPELNELFALIVHDMLETLRESRGSAFQTCHRVLETWRTLLDRQRGSLLTREALASLLGELLVLEQVLEADQPTALGAWTGPDGGVHDFSIGALAIEVKTSLRTTGRVIEVNDLGQLMEPENGELVLVFLRLRPSPGRGDTVPAVMERLVDKGLERVGLFEKAALVGYSPEHAPKYAELSFEIVERVDYLVDTAFPRLTASNFRERLPEQITKVRYSVTLDHPTPAPLEPQALRAKLTRNKSKRKVRL